MHRRLGWLVIPIRLICIPIALIVLPLLNLYSAMSGVIEETVDDFKAISWRFWRLYKRDDEWDREIEESRAVLR